MRVCDPRPNGRAVSLGSGLMPMAAVVGRWWLVHHLRGVDASGSARLRHSVLNRAWPLCLSRSGVHTVAFEFRPAGTARSHSGPSKLKQLPAASTSHEQEWRQIGVLKWSHTTLTLPCCS